MVGWWGQQNFTSWTGCSQPRHSQYHSLYCYTQGFVVILQVVEAVALISNKNNMWLVYMQDNNFDLDYIGTNFKVALF